MLFKKKGHIIAAVALAGVAAAVPMLSGCVNNYPTAEITIEYNEVEYVLEYKLYRNMYPQTVKHFIELADNGFYDGTIVHDYQSSYWYCGGYTYGEGYSEAYADGKEGLLDYLEANSKEKAYSELANPENLGANGRPVITPSVYYDFIDGNYSQPLDTLIGEFSNNQHKIDNGALKQSFGALRMYYTTKPGDEVQNKRVYLDKNGSEKGVQGDYKYNCATSLFSIQSGTSTSTDSNYCIFGTLIDTDKFTELKEAVAKSYTTTEVQIYVDNYDSFIEPQTNETTYRVVKSPIVIKTVKMKTY